MTFSEKKLYHQIHPFKLFTDISASISTIYLFWLHYFFFGLILHFLLPVLGSIIVIKFADLENLKKSAFGKYVKKYMSGQMEALRLSGDIITIIGAWYHSLFVIALGLAVILFAWLRGKIQI
jgi:hypothetical protein